MYPNLSPTAHGAQTVMIGAGVITGDAFAAAAFPDIETDTDYPVNGYIFKMSGVAQNENDRPAHLIFEGDFRSQRKLGENTEVYMQIQNTASVGTAFALQARRFIRMLVKLA